jgi:hypothetical protein
MNLYEPLSNHQYNQNVLSFGGRFLTCHVVKPY